MGFGQVGRTGSRMFWIKWTTALGRFCSKTDGVMLDGGNLLRADLLTMTSAGNVGKPLAGDSFVKSFEYETLVLQRLG